MYVVFLENKIENASLQKKFESGNKYTKIMVEWFNIKSDTEPCLFFSNIHFFQNKKTQLIIQNYTTMIQTISLQMRIK